jgi:hypothetical protein
MRSKLSEKFRDGSPCGVILAALALAGCHQTPPPPTAESRQQVALEAERKAASIEAEMNKNAGSESIARKPDDVSDRPPAPPPPSQVPPSPPSSPPQ